MTSKQPTIINSRKERGKDKPKAEDIAYLNSLQYLDKFQLCQLLRVSMRTIEKWTASKRLPHIKMGRSVRYDIVDVRAAIAKHKVKAVSAN